jgi:hypothetical protein
VDDFGEQNATDQENKLAYEQPSRPAPDRRLADFPSGHLLSALLKRFLGHIRR